MTTHELAKILMTLPDLPVSLHVNNHTYFSAADRMTHGPIKIGRLDHHKGDHLVIGNYFNHNINFPNWFVTEDLYIEP